jgi:hypothetical protein
MNQKDEDLREDVLCEAKQIVDEFQDRVFDYYTPGDVVLSRDCLQSFIAKIEGVQRYQLEEMERHLQVISRVSSDLERLFEEAKTRTPPRWAWDLRRFAELACGNYTFDSCFYDAEEWTAAITDRTIDNIKKSPDIWALVYFDMHN